LMTISDIMVAAGTGARVGNKANKLLLPLGGRPVLAWSLEAICRGASLHEIVLVTRAEMFPDADRILRTTPAIPPKVSVVSGGDERQDSVYQGLQNADQDADIILIHDGARPLVTKSIVTETVAAAERVGAAVAATPLSDTVKSVDSDRLVEHTLDRQKLWTVQTPQVFRREIIVEAHERSRKDGYVATDDAALVERLGFPVQLVNSRDPNLKITVPEDFAVAESILRSRGELSFSPCRVGFGYDVHRFTHERPLVLGGVHIEGSPGLEGHSDADALLHAVCDALLGAAGKRDIGYHFPNTDTELAGISSILLLEKTAEILACAGYQANNVDCTVIAEQPRLAEYVPAMVSNIADAVGIPPHQVSVKATTSEGLGFLGKAEGIACHAVVSLLPKGELRVPNQML